jgi:anti-sigma factor RsiW
MNGESNRCETYELELSSFLDGELSPAAAAEALEHAFGCASCREFYRRSRALQETVAELKDGELSAPAAPEAVTDRSEDLWRGVRERAGLGGLRSLNRFRARRSLRAAALVALGLGAGYLLSLAGGPRAAVLGSRPGAVPNPSTVVAASSASGAPAPATMDEHRFVALADELLRSDVRYQRAMLEVLRLVPALETGEGLKSEEPRDGLVRASNVADRTQRGAI